MRHTTTPVSRRREVSSVTFVRVLLVSPYHGGSHQAWGDGYARSSVHDVTTLTLPSRFWKWRMQGGAVTLAEAAQRVVTEAGVPDVVMVTDMVDLPTFLGLTRRALGNVPSVLYMHENQLTYPVSPRDHEDLTYGLMNWKSMLIADQIVFNSEFHRRELFAALPGVLKNFPDHRHLHHLEDVIAKSSVLPVGIDLARFPAKQPSGTPLVLWNQRWEHDKNPEEMIAALSTLVSEGAEFDLALCGENFRNEPSEFLVAKQMFGSRLRQFGWATDDEYAQLVADADVVLSTALHEFFGVSVIEALASGAYGVLPNRLSYPELLYPDSAGAHLYDDHEGLLALLRIALTQPWSASQEEKAHYALNDWAIVGPRYDRLLDGIV